MSFFIISDSEDKEQTDSARSKAYVSDKSCAEFWETEEYKLHKKECIEEPAVFMYNDSENTRPDQLDLCKVNGMSNVVSDDQEMDNLHGERDVGGEEEQDFEVVNSGGEDEVDAGLDNYDNLSEVDNIEEDFDKNMVDTDDNDLDSIKDDDTGDHVKPEPNPDMPSYVQSLSNLLSGVTGNSNSNVMLEPLEATKAAVAQFAENNLPGKEQDVNKLQTTLYNLQQQQIMQLQLIHQLQQQLIAGGVQSGQLPSALLNGQLPLGANFAGLNLTTSALSGLKSKAEASKSSSPSASPEPEMDQASPENMPDMKDSRPTTPHHSADKLSIASTPEIPTDLSKSSSTIPMASSVSLPSASTKGSSSTTPTSLPSSSLLDFSRSTTRSKY